ncbi:MAG TPA: murein L,D-transpeptidase, partial [Psychrobacter sp.]|nr:murein L,D-transpeptidase [Psychrobacter sp.]
LYAYDDKDNLIASYPTTVGSTATPSPTGTHTVEVKVHEPNYTYTGDDGSKSIIPPGPNNPVGLVWIGLSKPSYGIHGSPDPARISRQASAGCIRLTNWDALALLGVIQDGATVEFK